MSRLRETTGSHQESDLQPAHAAAVQEATWTGRPLPKCWRLEGRGGGSPVAQLAAWPSWPPVDRPVAAGFGPAP